MRGTGCTPELNDTATRQYQRESGDVSGRDAILEAVRSTRVLRHISAQRARALRRRVGRVIQSVRLGRFREVCVDHARLQSSEPVVGVDLQDPVHARHTDDYAVLGRESTSGESRAGTSRNDLDTFRVQHLDDAGDLVRRVR